MSGFDFGDKPRTFGEHMSRMSMTRTEVAIHDNDGYTLDRLNERENRSAFKSGVVAGATVGFLGLLLRR